MKGAVMVFLKALP